MAENTHTPYLYAVCPKGQSLKYLLPDAYELKTSEIMQSLLDRGVELGDIEYSSFTRERNPFVPLEVENLLPPRLLPDLPEIPDPGKLRPADSAVVVNASRLLSDFIEDKNHSYFMKWKNHGFIDVINNYVVPQMKNPDIEDLWFPGGTKNQDYQDIVSGKIRISYGLLWQFENSYKLKSDQDAADILLVRRNGLDANSMKSLAASIGCSLSMLNAGLSYMFKTDISVQDESIDHFRHRLARAGGQENLFSFWSLSQTFFIERLADGGQWNPIGDYRIPVFSKAIAIELSDAMSGMSTPMGTLPQMVTTPI